MRARAGGRRRPTRSAPRGSQPRGERGIGGRGRRECPRRRESEHEPRDLVPRRARVPAHGRQRAAADRIADLARRRLADEARIASRPRPGPAELGVAARGKRRATQHAGSRDVREDPEAAHRFDQPVGVARRRVFPGPAGRCHAREQHRIAAGSVSIRVGDRLARAQRLPDDAVDLHVADIAAFELGGPRGERRGSTRFHSGWIDAQQMRRVRGSAAHLDTAAALLPGRRRCEAAHHAEQDSRVGSRLRLPTRAMAGTPATSAHPNAAPTAARRARTRPSCGPGSARTKRATRGDRVERVSLPRPRGAHDVGVDVVEQPRKRRGHDDDVVEQAERAEQERGHEDRSARARSRSRAARSASSGAVLADCAGAARAAR